MPDESRLYLNEFKMFPCYDGWLEANNLQEEYTLHVVHVLLTYTYPATKIKLTTNFDKIILMLITSKTIQWEFYIYDTKCTTLSW